MAVFTVGWYPFSLNGYTQQQTGSAIAQGLGMLGYVANIRFVFSASPTIVIGSSASNDWAAATLQRWIWFSRTRKTNLEWWAMAMAHEFMHTWGFVGAPAFGHSKNAQSIMHPNGSTYRWFSPTDCRALVYKYGSPARTPIAFPPVLKEREKADTADKLWRKYDAQWRSLREARDAEVAKSNTDPQLLQELNRKTSTALAKRDAAGQDRRIAHLRANRMLGQFVAVYNPTVAFTQYDAIEPDQNDQPCTCFADLESLKEEPKTEDLVPLPMSA